MELPGRESTNIPYLGPLDCFLVAPNVLYEFGPKTLATDGVGFSMIVAFQRYQFWLDSIMWNRRYEQNKDRPYHDLVSGVPQWRFPIECLVPLSPKSLATLNVPICRRLSFLKVNPRLQSSFPPMIHNCQTYFLNISINTTPFPTIPTALLSP